MSQDQEHLRLLAIFHYVVGAAAILFSSLFLIHVGMGIFFLVAPESMAGSEGPPPPFVGWLFLAIGGALVLGGWTLGACLIAAGRSLARRRRYLFCLVMAAIACMLVPLGTVLGVFTIIVLMRPSVREMFGR
jgi:hypothetical protein